MYNHIVKSHICAACREQAEATGHFPGFSSQCVSYHLKDLLYIVSRGLVPPERGHENITPRSNMGLKHLLCKVSFICCIVHGFVQRPPSYGGKLKFLIRGVKCTRLMTSSPPGPVLKECVLSKSSWF